MDKFKLVRDFSKELTSTLDINELANFINDFAVMKLGAEHSSISLQNRRYTYGNEDKEVYAGIEEETLKYILKLGKILRIANPKSEMMFKNVNNIDLLDISIISLPLITKNKALGALNLYYKHLPGDELEEFLNLFAELSASSIMNSLAYTKLEQKSETDKLTNLSNRHSFDIETKNMIEKSFESESASSVMMIDIDNFKKYNDTYGHQKGDEVLEQMGLTLCSFDKETCKVFRYGGEELAILLPNANPEQAFETAEKIRKKVEETGNITVSIGLATCLNSSCSPQKMISEADKALYKAKKAGKNRTHSSVIVDNGLNAIDVQAASELGKK